MTTRINYLLIDGDYMYVAGNFTTIGGISANNIAKWNYVNNTWSALNTGVPSECFSLAIDNTDPVNKILYIGVLGTSAFDYLYKWNGSVMTDISGSTIIATVRSLCFYNTKLYIGSDDTGLYSYDGLNYNTIYTFGSGIIYSIIAKDNKIYIASNIPSKYCAYYDLVNTTWTNLSPIDPNGSCRSLAFYNSNLYVAGNFTTINGINANRIAVWNGTSWSNVGDGLNNLCKYITIQNNFLYAGGTFTQAGSQTVQRLARYDIIKEIWSSIPVGINDIKECNILTLNSSKILYVGGTFDSITYQNSTGTVIENTPNKLSQWAIIDFDSNGGSGLVNTITASYISPNNTIVIPSGSSLTRVGYTFSSWNTEVSGSGTTYQVGQTVSLSSSFTLYAQWAINTYTINFNTNSGSGSVNSISGTYGTNGTIPSGDSLVRVGYTFSNWNTNSNGSGTTYQVGEIVTFNNSFTLYAQWSINNYTISFDSNGGTGSVSSISGTYGTNGTIPSGDSLYRVGYTFSNWNSQQDGSGTSYQVGETVTFSNSFTLYAQWTANTYIITFEANNDSGNVITVPEKYDTTITIPNGNNLFDYGHVFENWNTNSSGSGTVYEAGEKIVVTETVTLYARWKIVDSDLSQTIDYSYRLVEGFVNFFMEYENQNDYIISIIDNEYNIFLSDSLANTPSFTDYHQFNLAVLLLAAGYLDFSKYM